MIKKLFTALFQDKNILYFNELSGDTIFNCNGMGILNIDLNKINVDDNFDQDDSDITILVILLAWHIKFAKRKELKKQLTKKIMPIARIPIDGGVGECQNMRKQEIEPMFIEEL